MHPVFQADINLHQANFHLNVNLIRCTQIC